MNKKPATGNSKPAMKFQFVWIGKTKNAPIRELLREYLDRIARFAGIEVAELRDRSDAGAGVTRILEREGEDILSKIASAPFVVVLDERGRQIDSVGLSELIEKHRQAGTKEIAFVIGGHNGLADSVRRRADFVMALSKMTLTHEMARVVLAEQVYRAFAIIHDLPYQK